jgi:hypothetical protein
VEYGTVLLIPIVHELGHWLAARLFGSRLRFTFEWGKLGPVPVPRWTWRWPDVSRAKLRIICHAGFALELALIPFMPWPYQAAAVLHFVAYPFYAGEASDFKGVI